MPVYSKAPLTSATGAESRAPCGTRLGLEIRSVNSRFLDLTFRLPDELRQHEPALRELITRHLKRGKVEVRAAIEAAGASTLPEPSTRLLQRLNAVQDNVRAWLPDAARPERGRRASAVERRRRQRCRLGRGTVARWPPGQ